MKNAFIVKNILTGKKFTKPFVVNEEVKYEGGVMITETDENGIITYANKLFVEMSGYTKEELIGSPHSIVRHPDMPKGLFRAMWKTISNKKVWRGYVKNLRKDGRYYWSLLYIQPKVDQSGKIIGYSGARKAAYPQAIKEISALYRYYYDDRYIDDKVFSSGASYHEFIISETQ